MKWVGCGTQITVSVRNGFGTEPGTEVKNTFYRDGDVKEETYIKSICPYIADSSCSFHLQLFVSRISF